MATLTSFDQVVNIIKNRSTVPCFIIGSNTGEYNPNNLATPASNYPYFDQDDFNLAPWLSSVTAEEINDIQEYLNSYDPEYPLIYIIPLYKLKEVLENFNKEWIRDTQQGIGADDDYFDYIPDMLDQYLQLVWAYCEYEDDWAYCEDEDNNSFKAYWNFLHKTIFKNFLKANDPNPEDHDGESLTEYFESTLKAVNEGKINFSSQYLV